MTQSTSTSADGKGERPFAYAYRYPHFPPDGATVIRFNHGEEVNGSKPLEAIPLYTAEQIAARPTTAEIGDEMVERARRDIAWAVDGADDDFAFEIRRDDREEGRVLTVADLRAALNVGALSMVREALEPDALLNDIAVMMSEFVDNWPHPKKVETALALIAKTMRAALNPPRHDFWGAGERDCPREIKAGNGELHTLRCKVCGEDNPRNDRCFNRASLSAHQPASGEGE